MEKVSYVVRCSSKINFTSTRIHKINHLLAVFSVQKFTSVHLGETIYLLTDATGKGYFILSRKYQLLITFINIMRLLNNH